MFLLLAAPAVPAETFEALLKDPRGRDSGSIHVGRAAAVINRMAPEQVAAHLKRHFPYPEPCGSLDRVVRGVRMHAAM